MDTAGTMNNGERQEELVQVPWHFLNLGGRSLAVKYFASANAYDILISDLIFMWREQLNGEDVVIRNNKMNPDIETSPKIILNHLKQLLTKSECTKLLTVFCCNEDELKLKSQSNLSSLTFNWEFHLTSVTSYMFAEQLTKPFITIAAELFRRCRQMAQILKNKDAQIEDYKAEGITLQRRHKDDQPFDEMQFTSNMVKSQEFANMVHEPEETAFNEDIKKLYMEIVNLKCQHKPEKRGRSVITKISGDTTTADDTLSTTVSSSTNSLTVEKDEEIERRRVLEQKLSEEKSKKDKKTKKLKL